MAYRELGERHGTTYKQGRRYKAGEANRVHVASDPMMAIGDADLLESGR
jgi:hypothetical protein